MAVCDFRVKYDPDKDTSLDVTKRILYSIIIRPIKNKKPRVIFASGDSGEGKSWGMLRLQELLCEIQKIDFSKFMESMNVFLPIEYPKKLNKLLHDPEYKKANIICIHEGREVIKAKLWHSYLNQTIADVNALSRSIKRMCIIVVSQFIRDISTDIRYTINYYCKIRRPLEHKARLYINVMWKDDRDLEKPKLRKRKLSGYLVYPDGKHRRFIPEYFELNKPSQDIIELFNRLDTEAKSDIIRNKTEKLIKDMEKELNVNDNKVENIVNWYLKNIESISLIGKKTKRGWKLNSEVRKNHDLTEQEAKQFEFKLAEKLKERGLVE